MKTFKVSFRRVVLSDITVQAESKVALRKLLEGDGAHEMMLDADASLDQTIVVSIDPVS